MVEIHVKICGITRQSDFAIAARLGIDFAGFIFVPGSQRCVTPEEVRKICKGFSRQEGPVRIGVFADQPADEVLATCEAAGIRTAQLHGSESPQWCEQLGIPFWKALTDPSLISRYRSFSDNPVLLDASGVERSSSILPLAAAEEALKQSSRIILAGGISPDNVDGFLARNPWGIDFSSSVESSPGVKDHCLVEQMVEKVRRYCNGIV